MRDLVAQLHAQQRHEHVAAVIRAALRHGQPQPWMYEVLALTLEIQGAPKAEVERALLSQIDFAATDAAGLMISAAYLTRFGAERPALRLYRQASDLAPERPEPYLLGPNMDLIDLSNPLDPRIVSTGPRMDPTQCVASVVSGGRLFYTALAGGLQVAQVFGAEAARFTPVWAER